MSATSRNKDILKAPTVHSLRALKTVQNIQRTMRRLRELVYVVSNYEFPNRQTVREEIKKFILNVSTVSVAWHKRNKMQWTVHMPKFGVITLLLVPSRYHCRLFGPGCMKTLLALIARCALRTKQTLNFVTARRAACKSFLKHSLL